MNAPPLQAGVMGWPVSHALSPCLHQYWLQRHNIAGTYTALAVEPEHLQRELRALPVRGFRGVNLTLPHKEAALGCVDHCDAEAQRAGAVNTVIVRPDTTLEGRNTDIFGFYENLRCGGFPLEQLKQRPATILGAGGAARAIVVALQNAGCCEIRLVNRTRARAEHLAGHLGGPLKIYAETETATALRDARLLVNTTSLGMKNQPALSIDLTALPPDATVTDIVYNPLQTQLLQQAQQRQLSTIDGLGMLLHQARPAFQAFYGPDPEVTEDLRRHVLAWLSP